MILELVMLLIGALLPFLVEWLERENRRKRAYEASIRAFDRALVDRDTDRLSLVFNELRDPGRDPGRPDDPEPAQR